MAFTMVSDELGNEIKPLLPSEPPKPRGRQPRMPYRACLSGVVYVLQTGIRCRMVRAELGCGSGVTCWCGMHDLMRTGV